MLHGGKQAETILDMQQKQASKEPLPHVIAWVIGMPDIEPAFQESLMQVAGNKRRLWPTKEEPLAMCCQPDGAFS